jgi:hypothetical protein
MAEEQEELLPGLMALELSSRLMAFHDLIRLRFNSEEHMRRLVRQTLLSREQVIDVVASSAPLLQMIRFFVEEYGMDPSHYFNQMLWDACLNARMEEACYLLSRPEVQKNIRHRFWRSANGALKSIEKNSFRKALQITKDKPVVRFLLCRLFPTDVAHLISTYLHY